MCRLKNKFINLLVTWICSLTVKEGGDNAIANKVLYPFFIECIKNNNTNL